MKGMKHIKNAPIGTLICHQISNLVLTTSVTTSEIATFIDNGYELIEAYAVPAISYTDVGNYQFSVVTHYLWFKRVSKP